MQYFIGMVVAFGCRHTRAMTLDTLQRKVSEHFKIKHTLLLCIGEWQQCLLLNPDRHIVCCLSARLIIHIMFLDSVDSRNLDLCILVSFSAFSAKIESVGHCLLNNTHNKGYCDVLVM